MDNNLVDMRTVTNVTYNFKVFTQYLTDAFATLRDCKCTAKSPMNNERFLLLIRRRTTAICQSHVDTDFERLSSSRRGSQSKKQSQLVPGFTELNAFNANKGPERSRCCNYCYKGSVLSTAIRQCLSAPSLAFERTLCLSKVRKALILTFFFLFILHLPSVDAVSSLNSPLLKTDATLDKSFRVFYGRDSRTEETWSLDFQNLKIIPEWDDLKDVLLLSGRDYIFMINASTVTNKPKMNFTKRLKWTSKRDLKFICSNMGKSKFECNNFIRVMELQEDNRLYVCGTNSYDPKCRYYSKKSFGTPDSTSDSSNYTDGDCDHRCPCPYNPTKSSVSLYSNTSAGYRLFSASIDNFMANVPVLMRKSDPPISSIDKWFKDPTFIKLLEAKNGKLYLFFRETARSVETGKEETTYGRVAQVCKNDKGGTSVLMHERWTSFLKARLKCSISDSEYEASLSFDNLTSVSNITTIIGPDGQPLDVIFATFTTPWNWKTVAMSAVCVFSMNAIENLFNNGRFLSEQVIQLGSARSRNTHGSNSMAVPVSGDDVPNPRPGSCLDERTQFTDKMLHFNKKHFLMFDPVLPLLRKPIYVSEQNVRATHIIADRDNSTGSVLLYVGNENGKILRIRPDLFQSDDVTSLVLEEITVAVPEKCNIGSIPCGVLAMNVYRPSSASTEPSLFVAFTDRLVHVPLAVNCVEYSSAKCCNVDPACGWIRKKCLPRKTRKNHAFPMTSQVASVPSNCQKIKPRSCTSKELASHIEELCGIKLNDRSLTENNRNQQKKKYPNDFHDSSLQQGTLDLIDTRSIHNRRVESESVNDQPESSASPITVNRRGCERIRGATNTNSMDNFDELTTFFIKRVLPSISTEFAETVQVLSDADRQEALFRQLRNAMIETTRLVLRNHKMDHCLPNQTINSLTHSYPLLLREIESWHSLALKKMEPDARWACWENPWSDCTARVSFSASLAPTLWGPLTTLIQEFGGSCDQIASQSDQVENDDDCHVLPGVLPCSDERARNSQLCQPKKCRFSKYAVDVKAFFRHANDSRNFLSLDNGNEPFRKPAVRDSTDRRHTLRSHFELAVNGDKPFQIYYYPDSEKVKIMFFYAQVPDCVTTEHGCSDDGENCNADLEKKLNQWFNNFMSKLAISNRVCNKQINKALREDKALASRQVRQKLSILNSLLQEPPRKCLYVKRNYNFHSKLWIPLIERATSSGALYSANQERVVFNLKSDVVRFFEQRCPDGPTWSRGHLVNMRRSVHSKPRRSRANDVAEVEVLVSESMPFVIERLKQGRLRIKFFTINSRPT